MPASDFVHRAGSPSGSTVLVGPPAEEAQEDGSA